ncbi:transmembrane protease serine 9-like [Amphibalanus amphitrite]|uniref:transmembrane protease serine 9-like n=1 Tax=Amphibalanus amphitrite TaxID=1232801 RepID=UPI001C91327A|nr:transmembrane protease serine 9-like [Amphibalanus amphitrite]
MRLRQCNREIKLIAEPDLLGSPFCGGVLIGWGLVLTAAHCLNGDLSINEDGAVAALLGGRAAPLANGTTSGPVRRVSHRLVHPSADLALALIDVLYDGLPGWVWPACLPLPGAPLAAGRRAEVAGWSPPPAELHQATLRVTEPVECREAYRAAGRRFPGTEDDSAVCAVPDGGGSVPAESPWCSARGGWPLIVPNSDGLLEVVGISTSGAGCDQSGVPSVFTRVSAYIDWIAASATVARRRSEPGGAGAEFRPIGQQGAERRPSTQQRVEPSPSTPQGQQQPAGVADRPAFGDHSAVVP